jgi:hypothetical protein
MKIRRLLLLAVTIGLCVVASTPVCRTSIVGFCRGESKYQGRYTNYWRWKLQDWEAVAYGADSSGPPIANCPIHPWVLWRRRVPWWREWATKCLGVNQEDDHSLPPLLDGDEAALPVLTELLKDQLPTIRWMATQGLAEMGPKARPATPALIQNLQIEEGGDWDLVADAIGKIDPEAADRIKDVPRPDSHAQRVFGGIQ